MSYLAPLYTALITPFNEDSSLDVTTLSKLLQHHLIVKMPLLICGSTAEASMLSDIQKNSILNLCTRILPKDYPLMIGIQGKNTQDTINTLNLITNSYTHFNYFLISPIPYILPCQQAIYQYYSDLAKNTSAQIIIYNHPGRTNVYIKIDTIISLAKNFSNIIGVKDASSESISNCQAINVFNQSHKKNFKFFSGNDNCISSLQKHLPYGLISVIGNLFPNQTLEWALANYPKTHFLAQISNILAYFPNPQGIKMLMSHKKLIKNNLIKPLLSKDLESIEAEKLKKINYLLDNIATKESSYHY